MLFSLSVNIIHCIHWIQIAVAKIKYKKQLNSTNITTVQLQLYTKTKLK